jgi:hypothetical protein
MSESSRILAGLKLFSLGALLVIKFVVVKRLALSGKTGIIITASKKRLKKWFDIIAIIYSFKEVVLL